MESLGPLDYPVEYNGLRDRPNHMSPTALQLHTQTHTTQTLHTHKLPSQAAETRNPVWNLLSSDAPDIPRISGGPG